MDPERWYQRLWKSITSPFRVGEKETFTPVDMIDCMDGKPLTDKCIQDCLSDNQPSLPEIPPKTLPIEGMNGKHVFLQLPPKKRILYEHYWNGESLLSCCIPEDEESVKDSIDVEPAKEEPESILETYARKRNERDMTQS
ncbi:hypothetical protein TNIN_226241 [Trichonephila inaurata madagascariensis]|uniref:Uncharacterized protein n=1 Tax=Trichonephila inaurata madagascariensis TaxID=2747483 RepID=A0A8X6XXB4_9ARAC|nr:hypothetical protein TNIN_226241 [Trichonephila inaurata madagascariensis]